MARQPESKILKFQALKSSTNPVEYSAMWPDHGTANHGKANAVCDSFVGRLSVENLATARLILASLAAFHLRCYVPRFRERALHELIRAIHECLAFGYTDPDTPKTG